MLSALASAGVTLVLLGAAALARRMLDHNRLTALGRRVAANGPRWMDDPALMSARQ